MLEMTTELFIEIGTGVFIAPHIITEDNGFCEEDKEGYMLYITDANVRALFMDIVEEEYQEFLENELFLMVYISGDMANFYLHNILAAWCQSSDIETFFEQADEDLWVEIYIPRKPLLIQILSNKSKQQNRKTGDLALN